MPLYKRPGSPHWWVRIGRKTRRSTGTDDREQAEEFERILTERTWRREKLGDRGALSWREAADRYLKSSTRERKRDRAIIAWLEPRIGEEAVSDVADSEALEQLQEHGLAAGWAHSTVDRMMRTVRAVLRDCWHRKNLPAPPHVPMYGADDEAEPRFITREQFGKLRRELPPHLEIAARFAVVTLLRMRAQSYLTWDRIDIEGRRGWIPKRRAGRKGTQKAGQPFGFPLSDEAVRALRDARTLAPEGERVFQYEGKGVDNFHTAAFRKAVARAGIPDFRWHDLRHTGASWAVQSGVTLQELMALGDWKSYRSVLIYAHLAPSNAASAAQILSTKVAQAVRLDDDKTQ